MAVVFGKHDFCLNKYMVFNIIKPITNNNIVMPF